MITPRYLKSIKGMKRVCLYTTGYAMSKLIILFLIRNQ
ncbi:hypothetical protein BANRA_05153 [Klebsiella pneumoniae]|nr:hypothetical protein BANRA_05153 [Klebsiella pneumoniae]